MFARHRGIEDAAFTTFVKNFIGGYSGTPLLAQVHLAFAHTVGAFANTHVGAFIMGREAQYDTMHAASPVFASTGSSPHITPAQMRATLAVNHDRVLPLSGIHVDGPSMQMRPTQDQVRAMLQATWQGAAVQSQAVRARVLPTLRPQYVIQRPRMTIHPMPRPMLRPSTTASANRPAALVKTAMVNTGNLSTTGVNRYWEYEEGAIPGVGKYMVNVASGTLLVQSDDVDVHERGIDLAIRRTWNSQMGVQRNWNSTAASDDGSPTPGMWGQGFTSNLDTHLALNSSGGITVWDIDGARYDYGMPAKNACLAGPPGVYMMLCDDGANGYYLWKKSGTLYHYYTPDPSVLPANQTALLGRLQAVDARNENNFIRLDYSWVNADASNSQNLRTITVVHADGHTLTLNFAPNPNNPSTTLLMSVQRPGDSAPTVFYTYDQYNDLQTVTLPANGNGRDGATPNNRTYYYGYAAPGQISWVASPRYSAGDLAGSEGGYVAFSYDSSERLAHVQLEGVANFTPSDGTSLVLQPQATYQNADQNIAQINYTYSSGETEMRDSDGHATNWLYDSSNRVTTTDEWTGASSTCCWLTSYEDWDAANNLIATLGPRSNGSTDVTYRTDYAYDMNGNTIAVALPAVSTNQGTFRPTSWYSYDQYNNVLAYSDPTYVGATGYDWTNRPATDTLCTSGPGATYYKWDYSDTSYEPYGRLTDTYTPLGYHVTLTYNGSAQFGDNGLPTDVIGDQIPQQDGKTRQPQQHFVYDTFGNVATYNKGYGNWQLTYDPLNQVSTSIDPDGVTDRTCYYPNGEVKAEQSAYQYSLDGTACGSNSVSYGYDADGNQISETNHVSCIANQSCSPGTTDKWYDGEDRLVEVQLPHDPTDFLPYAWMTRYFYDLSRDGAVSDDGASFSAHGNLYKTQEYLPTDTAITNGSAPTSPVWLDVRGTSFDALDRSLASYENAFGAKPKATNTYDADTYLGLLTDTSNAVGQTKTLSYYSTGWLYSGSYSDATPTETYVYDAAGRPTSITSSTFGMQSMKYDADGHETQVVEPSGNGYTSPATITYEYYGDGMRKGLSVTSSALTQNQLLQYSYRNDGLRQTLGITWPNSANFTWTYTDAGRELTQTDPYTGVVVHAANLDSTATFVQKTTSYDPYGRVHSMTLPQGIAYSGISYDIDGNTLGYTVTPGPCDPPPGAMCNSSYTRGTGVNVRGEITSDGTTAHFATVSKPSPESFGAESANGFLCTAAGTSTGCGDSFDVRNGLLLHSARTTDDYSYDEAGRQTQTTNPTPPNYPAQATAYATRSYDAENHIVSEAFTGGNFWCYKVNMCGPGSSAGSSGSGLYPYVAPGTTISYAWGPNGHPLLISGQPGAVGSGTFSTSIHWDGDQVMFTSESTGSFGFRADEVAMMSTGALSVLDRDMNGAIVSEHDKYGWSAFSDATSFETGGQVCKPVQSGGCSGGINKTTYGSFGYGYFEGASGALAQTHLDGYNDGWGNTFQGVRSQDSNSGQWSTPDAYAGDAHDPMSQKPFMYDGNNPIAYQDPTGYMICLGPCTQAVGHLLDRAEAAISAAAKSLTKKETWTNAGKKLLGAVNGIVEAGAVAGNAMVYDDFPAGYKAPGQINRDIRNKVRGTQGMQAAHTGNTNTLTQDHIHFEDGTALNRDGSPHDGGGLPTMSKARAKYLKSAGFQLPKQ